MNVVSIAINLAVCYEPGRESISDWRSILIAVTSVIFSFGFRNLNSAYIVIGGALAGYVLSLI